MLFETPLPSSPQELRPVVAAVSGQLAASPGPSGSTAHRLRMFGTSNAAAFVSRTAGFLHAELLELVKQSGGSLGQANIALMQKALLVHGARWGACAHDLQQMGFSDDDVRRFVGYGALEIPDVSECTPARATAIGTGELEVDAAHEHRFPLPPALAGKRGWRRLTTTLAWFTPLSIRSQRWRQAHLWLDSPLLPLQLSRTGPDHNAVQRGTVQHQSFEGEAAVAFVDGAELVLKVNCREDAPGLTQSVPYALAVTLEVAEAMSIDIYSQISQRVAARARVTP